VVYLDHDVMPVFEREARKSGQTMSAYLRERLNYMALNSGREEYQHLALNALLKYHEKGNLIELVDAAWEKHKAKRRG